MNDENIEICSGKITEYEDKLTIEEFCEICRIEPDFLFELIEEGIIEPDVEEKTTRQFSYASVEKVRIVIRMQRDLRVNLPGAALVLQLLEEKKK